MVTSSNGSIFRVSGLLCGEFTGHQWNPRTGASDAELWCFLWSEPWINGLVNNDDTGDLRCHHAHYDATVMLLLFYTCMHYSASMCWLTSPEYHIYALLIWIIIGSDDGVLPVRHQAIDWTSDDFSSIRFRETLSIKMWSRLNNFHWQNYTQHYHLWLYRHYVQGEMSLTDSNQGSNSYTGLVSLLILLI